MKHFILSILLILTLTSFALAGSPYQNMTSLEVVTQYKHIQVRLTKFLSDGGKTYALGHSRFVLSPDCPDVKAAVLANFDDPTSASAKATAEEISKISLILWTSSVKSAWAARTGD